MSMNFIHLSKIGLLLLSRLFNDTTEIPLSKNAGNVKDFPAYLFKWSVFYFILEKKKIIQTAKFVTARKANSMCRLDLSRRSTLPSYLTECSCKAGRKKKEKKGYSLEGR